MSDSEYASLYQKLINGLKKNYNLRNEAIAGAIHFLVNELHGKSWRSSATQTIFNFNRMEMCCAYLHRYATCHTELVRQSMHNFVTTTLSPRIRCPGGHLRIASVGGGPGNDLVGACYALFPLLENISRLHLSVIDNMHGWCAAFKAMLAILQECPTLSRLGQWLHKVEVTDSFLAADILGATPSSELQAELSSANIVLMVKFLSLMADEQKRRAVEAVLQMMSPGALLVVIDSDWPGRCFHPAGGQFELIYLSNGGCCVSTPREAYGYHSIRRCHGDVVVVRKRARPDFN